MSIDYAQEKLLLAAYDLVISEDSPQQRLGRAFTTHLLQINAQDDLPPASREAYLALREIVTGAINTDNEKWNRVVTLALMDIDTARSVIADIVSLHEDVTRFCAVKDLQETGFPRPPRAKVLRLVPGSSPKADKDQPV